MALPAVGWVLASGAAAALGAGTLVNVLAVDHGVPPRAAQAYLAAAHTAPCQPFDYRILAAIGAVESGHGTSGGAELDDDGKLTRHVVSTAAAKGPMQFIDSTWARYATDGDGDGTKDINDIDDAAASAAALLCASNVDEDLTEAVGAYNGGAGWRGYAESRGYVAAVDERIAALPPDDGSTVGNHVSTPLPDDHGRLCGVGEWLSAQGDCATDARLKALYLWAQIGHILDSGDTRRLHAVWAKLNGTPAAPVTNQPISATTPGPGLKADLAGLPGSAGLQEDFAKRLEQLVRYAPGAITINQGYRTPEDALQKWKAKLKETNGDEAAARRWVAKTTQRQDGTIDCGSNHCKGLAADLYYEDGLTEQWAHANAARYGLAYPLPNEPWHCEPAGIRSEAP